jgi:hypothetical protein
VPNLAGPYHTRGRVENERETFRLFPKKWKWRTKYGKGNDIWSKRNENGKSINGNGKENGRPFRRKRKRAKEIPKK